MRVFGQDRICAQLQEFAEPRASTLAVCSGAKATATWLCAEVVDLVGCTCSMIRCRLLPSPVSVVRQAGLTGI